MYISVDSLPPDLSQIVELLQKAVHLREGHCLELLQVLRVLEDMHRSILDREFQAALPDTRQDLYQLLQDIEEAGKWPYIPRMHLRLLLRKLEYAETPDLDPNVKDPDSGLDYQDLDAD